MQAFKKILFRASLPGTQAVYLSFQWSKWAGGKNLRKNQVFWPTFIFWSISSDTLVPWSPWSLGAQAAYLSFQWLKWAGGKNLRKNIMFWPTFIFWSISSDTLVPWSPWSPGAQQCTGSLSQLPVHEMNWGKKFKTKPSVLINFCFLVNFITHTGPMVWSPWSPGAQAAYLSLHWLKWAGGKNLRKN